MGTGVQRDDRDETVQKSKQKTHPTNKQMPDSHSSHFSEHVSIGQSHFAHETCLTLCFRLHFREGKGTPDPPPDPPED